MSTTKSTTAAQHDHQPHVHGPDCDHDHGHDGHIPHVHGPNCNHDHGHQHGHSHAMAPVRSNKVGRNEVCPCGSGRKYKKCCLERAQG